MYNGAVTVVPNAGSLNTVAISSAGVPSASNTPSVTSTGSTLVAAAIVAGVNGVFEISTVGGVTLVKRSILESVCVLSFTEVAVVVASNGPPLALAGKLTTTRTNVWLHATVIPSIVVAGTPAATQVEGEIAPVSATLSLLVSTNGPAPVASKNLKVVPVGYGLVGPFAIDRLNVSVLLPVLVIKL